MYVIKALFRVDPNAYTVQEFVLNKESQWVIATGDAIMFYNVESAVNFAKGSKIIESLSRLGSGSMPYIVGPRGGKYSIFTGRLLK